MASARPLLDRPHGHHALNVGSACPLPDGSGSGDFVRPRRASARTRIFGWSVAAAFVAAGLVLRLWFVLGPLGRSPSSDEDIVGLMALHLVRHGELRAFYWGQSYGGSLEAILVAPFVAVFGATILGLRSASVLLSLAMAALTWRIARHTYAPIVAIAGGILVLWWPLALVYFGTQERGFYPLSAVLGLSTILMAVNVDADPRSVRHWVGLGLSAGLGWWASPNVAYFAIPAAVWLGLRGHWRHPRNIAVAITATAIGSSVWLIANIQSGFASGRVLPGLRGSSSYWGRIRFYWQTGLPFALGLRYPHTGRWYWSPPVGRVLYTAALIALLLCAWRALRTWSIDLVLMIVAPFIFAFFPPTWLLSEGRYTYFIAAMLPLVLCRMLTNRWSAGAVVMFVAVTGIAFARSQHELKRPIAASILPITQELERAGYHTAVANYWIGIRITYESSEHVIASPLPGQVGVRYLPYVRLIVRSNPAYVFDMHGSGSRDGWLLRKLAAGHVSYRVVRATGYYAVLPARRVIAVP